MFGFCSRRYKCISQGQYQIIAVWNCLGVTILRHFVSYIASQEHLTVVRYIAIDNRMKIHRGCVKSSTWSGEEWRVMHFHLEIYLWWGEVLSVVSWSVIDCHVNSYLWWDEEIFFVSGYPSSCTELPAISYPWTVRELSMVRWRVTLV